MPDQITFIRLSSGYIHIKKNIQQWAQVPHWPCSEQVLRAHVFDASWADSFIAEVMATVPATPTEGSE